MRHFRRLVLALLLAVVAGGCSTAPIPIPLPQGDGGPPDRGGPPLDAGAKADVGAPRFDGARPDAATTGDAGLKDGAADGGSHDGLLDGARDQGAPLDGKLKPDALASDGGGGTQD